VISIDNAVHSRALSRLGIEFHQLDWREGLELFGHLADVIHASPPCQHYSIASRCRPGR
jgi:site-specific DNA-cytosine methylase